MRQDGDPALRIRSLKVVDAFQAIAFVTVIVMILVVFLFKSDKTVSKEENRILTQAPRLSMEMSRIENFPEDFEQYFADQFGLRPLLLKIYGHVSLFLCAGKPPHDLVVLGDNGWLFHDYVDSIDYYRGKDLYTPPKLHKVVEKIRQHAGQAWRCGAHYYIVVVPIKHTVYPDYVSDAIGPAGARTRADQLVKSLRQDTDVTVVDLRSILSKARAACRDPIYYKTDSHWNHLGAFFGAQAILHEVAKSYPQVREPGFEEYRIRHFSRPGGDLS